MKHAGPESLDRLGGLLSMIRAIDGLQEKRPGIFYRKSRAFLHFHEDPSGLFADVRDLAGVDFDRFNVTNPRDWAGVVEEVVRRI